MKRGWIIGIIILVLVILIAAIAFVYLNYFNPNRLDRGGCFVGNGNPSNAVRCMDDEVKSICDSSDGCTPCTPNDNGNRICDLGCLSNSGKIRMCFVPIVRKILVNREDVNIGFATKLVNVHQNLTNFSYTVEVDSTFDIRKNCQINKDKAESFITSEKNLSNIQLAVGEEDYKLVLFSIPKDAPLCTIPYIVNVKSEGQFYTSGKVYVTIKR